jgi:hypothetical protein
VTQPVGRIERVKYANAAPPVAEAGVRSQRGALNRPLSVILFSSPAIVRGVHRFAARAGRPDRRRRRASALDQPSR